MASIEIFEDDRRISSGVFRTVKMVAESRIVAFGDQGHDERFEELSRIHLTGSTPDLIPSKIREFDVSFNSDVDESWSKDMSA